MTLFFYTILLVGCHDGKSEPAASKDVSVIPGTFTNSIGMTMMKLSTGYYVSMYETRQLEFETVMGYNPSQYIGDNHPVETITAAEADEFCRRLTEFEREKGTLPDGYVYDLPTFSQWMQYVADANLDQAIVPRKGVSFETHQPVGNGEVNRLGLYDLRGNIREYSKDPYRYSASVTTRTMLGAYWNTHRKDFLQKDNRCGFTDASHKDFTTGFRCVLVPVTTE